TAPVRPAEREGHTLSCGALRVGEPEDGVQVRMEIDESQGDYVAGGVYRAAGECRIDRRSGDRGDCVVRDGNVRRIPGLAGAVDNRTAGDEDVVADFLGAGRMHSEREGKNE